MSIVIATACENLAAFHWIRCELNINEPLNNRLAINDGARYAPSNELHTVQMQSSYYKSRNTRVLRYPWSDSSFRVSKLHRNATVNLHQNAFALAELLKTVRVNRFKLY